MTTPAARPRRGPPRLRIIEAAELLFTEHRIAEAAGTPLPTLYRLFGFKRALLAAALDTSFGGDDQPIAFGDRPAARAARAETDPAEMVTPFTRPEPWPGRSAP